MKNNSVLLWVLILTLANISPASAQDDNRYRYEDKRIRVSITPRTPEQTTAFYYARGFPDPVINELKQQCFLTISIHNLSKQTLVHDVEQWTITSSGQPVERLGRQYWFAWFRSHDINLAVQSTFRWTLLPDSLDFFPAEGEGGNIIIPYTDKPVSMRMQFKLVSNMETQPFHIDFPAIRCAR